MGNAKSRKRAQTRARQRQARKRQRLENERFQTMCQLLDSEPEHTEKKAKAEQAGPTEPAHISDTPQLQKAPAPEPSAINLPKRQNVSLNAAVLKQLFDQFLLPNIGSDLRALNDPLIDKLYDLQPLAAVCRSWRQAALPLFYRSAVCHIKALPRRKGQLANDRPRHARRSNVGLILTNGCTDIVQRLVIDLTGDTRPDLPVTVLKNEGFANASWQNISALHLHHRHAADSHLYARDSVTRFNAFLLHTLPNLSSVTYCSADDRTHYSEFPLDGLLGSTLSQLSEIKVNSGLVPVFNATSFLPKLTRMTICCPMPDGAAALPMVFSESLVSLHMCFTSAETLWQRFYTSNTGCIVFTRLESLVLEYTEPVGKEAKQHRIPSLFADCMDDGELCISAEDDLVEVTGKQVHPVFHKLEHLSVLKYPHSIMRVLKYFDVSRIPYVSLRDVSHGYEGLAASAITEMKSLRVHLSRPIEDSGQFQSWLNCMFSVASSMSSLQLQASVQVPATLPDIIGLSSLTSLSLGMRLDIGCLPNLLSRLPNLRCLAVHLHPVISSRSDRSPGTWGPQLLPYLPALSRSLTQLVAYVADVDCGESTGCGSWDVERELTWAVARVPSLLVLKSEEWTCKAIRSWIKELLCDDRSEARFKHLKSLEMSVWKY